MAETSASKLAKRIQTDGSTHYKSTTAPASAVTGDIWFDTSSNSNRLKIYDGASWVLSSAGATYTVDFLCIAGGGGSSRDLGGGGGAGGYRNSYSTESAG